MNRSKQAAFIVALVAVVALSVGFVVRANSGSNASVVIEHVDTLNLTVSPQSASLGEGQDQVVVEGENGPAFGGAVATADLIVRKQNFKNGFQVNGTDVMSSARALTNLTGLELDGTMTYRESSTNVSQVTTTLTSDDSGKTFYISGTTSTILLPATSTAIIGATYRVVVGGALSVSSSVKTATGADEIEGTLIVAGAVVDCDAEDEIVFGASVENIGDYVEFRWSGTYWMIGDSGALTATALVCTKT